MDVRYLAAVIERDLLIHAPVYRDALDVLAAVIHVYWHHRGFSGDMFPPNWNSGDSYRFTHSFRDGTPAVDCVIARGADFIETEGLILHDDWVENSRVIHMDRLVLLLLTLSGRNEQSLHSATFAQDVFFGRMMNVRMLDRAPRTRAE